MQPVLYYTFTITFSFRARIAMADEFHGRLRIDRKMHLIQASLIGSTRRKFKAIITSRLSNGFKAIHLTVTAFDLSLISC